MMISSEVFPFAKAGGLGDVVPQLSEALSDAGHRVKILMPLYKTIDRSALTPLNEVLTIQVEKKNYTARLFHLTLSGGSEVFFLEEESLFARSGIYVDEHGNDYPDNLLRFAVLSKATFAFCRSLNWQPDIIHSHDWPSALVMTMLQFPENKDFASCRAVFTIHNIGYQGIFEYDQLPVLGISREEYQKYGLEYYEKICLLRSALVCADSIVAVSPQYAKEITGEEYGFGMQDVLNKRKSRLFGILNGADYTIWNPSTDGSIPHQYDSDTIEAKSRNKHYVQKKYGFDLSERVPLIGIVSRLVGQKGFDLLLGENGAMLRRICSELDVQILTLGSGEAWIEDAFKQIASEYNNLKVIIGYDEDLSHLIQAASDFFLVPSLYEPCGLTQLYALRYGSLPIVSPTGGLLDTVRDVSAPGGTGILIGTPDSPTSTALSSEGIFQSLQRAVSVWKDRDRYLGSQQEAMRQRFGWEEAAQKYAAMYAKGRRR